MIIVNFTNLFNNVFRLTSQCCWLILTYKLVDVTDILVAAF